MVRREDPNIDTENDLFLSSSQFEP